jgi:hypothetical protein
MQRRFGTTSLTLLLAVLFIAAGVLVLANQSTGPRHYDCAADRRSLEIGIDSYRSRFGATTEPTRAELKKLGIIDNVDKAYTYVFINGVPQFEAVTGTGCQ